MTDKKTGFTFDDEIDDVLVPEKNKKSVSRGGRPKKKETERKTKCVNCYFTEAEFVLLQELIGETPASTYIRSLIIPKLKQL